MPMTITATPRMRTFRSWYSLEAYSLYSNMRRVADQLEPGGNAVVATGKLIGWSHVPSEEENS